MDWLADCNLRLWSFLFKLHSCSLIPVELNAEMQLLKQHICFHRSFVHSAEATEFVCRNLNDFDHQIKANGRLFKSLFIDIVPAAD